jgi:hypothetical protein
VTDDTRKQVVDISKAKSSALVAERRNKLAQQAYQLHVAGKSYYQIGVELGLPAAESKKLVAQTIRDAAKLVDDATKTDLLLLELARLDAMQAAVWDRVMEGHVSSGEYVLHLLQQRVKLLELDAGTVVNNTVNAVVVPANEEQYAAALRVIASGGQ